MSDDPMGMLDAVWLVRVTGLSPIATARLLHIDRTELELVLQWMCICGHSAFCGCPERGCTCMEYGCPCADPDPLTKG